MELRSLGKYRLVSEIPGAGESCRVYLVRHEDEPNQERPTYVAKLFQPPRASVGADAARRRAAFEHEVEMLQSINHPSCPTVHAAGDQDGIPYVVMDRVDGVQLSTLLGHDEGHPRQLTKEVAVYIMGQLADALRHLHTMEFMDDDQPTPLALVHRSINPTNVMVSRNGDAVLIGFGNSRSAWLAKQHDDPDAGDLGYMAPERIVPGGEASQSTDLFSMAVMLWEMLRGERCLAGETDEQTRENITRFDISQASRRVSGLSPKLSEIVRKNLDRDPGRRYSGAYQMLQRLAQSPEAQFAEQSRAALGEAVTVMMGRIEAAHA